MVIRSAPLFFSVLNAVDRFEPASEDFDFAVPFTVTVLSVGWVDLSSTEVTPRLISFSP